MTFYTVSASSRRKFGFEQIMDVIFNFLYSSLYKAGSIQYGRLLDSLISGIIVKLQSGTSL